MTTGSQQLRVFRRAIRDGATIEEACAATGPDGINLSEAKIHLAKDAKNPPPPEAFELLASPAKEPAMATAARHDDDDRTTEYQKPDAAKAFNIYDKQIKPKLAKIDTARGECSQPWQDIKEHAHFPRPVMNFLIMLENIDDDAKRDHFLLALSGGLEHRKLFLPRDLVTMANGEDGGSVIPFGDRKAPQLATLQMSDGSETDLADAGEEDDDFDEATEDEIAQQEGRRGPADDGDQAQDPPPAAA